MRIVGKLRLRRVSTVGAVLTILAGISLQSALMLNGPARATAADAPGTGTAVSYTLEGCRGSTADYIGGTFVCSPAKYTSGNLGKDWNELDQVPVRVTLDAGATHLKSETFSFVVAVDGRLNSGGPPGFDQLSALTLNSALSSAGCPAVTVSSTKSATPGVGGTYTTLYREVTVSNLAPSTTCVYDLTARLAVDSSQNAGSSLHVNLANLQLSTRHMGARDLSINPGEASVPTTTTTTTVPATTTTTTTTTTVPPTTTTTTTIAPAINTTTTQPRTSPGSGTTTTTRAATSPTTARPATPGVVPGTKPPNSVPGSLAFTGRKTGLLSGVAVGLIIAGLLLLGTSRVRRPAAGDRP